MSKITTNPTQPNPTQPNPTQPVTQTHMESQPSANGWMVFPQLKVFDEIHERSADADFLSLVVRLLLHRCPEARGNGKGKGGKEEDGRVTFVQGLSRGLGDFSPQNGNNFSGIYHGKDHGNLKIMN